MPSRHSRRDAASATTTSAAAAAAAAVADVDDEPAAAARPAPKRLPKPKLVKEGNVVLWDEKKQGDRTGKPGTSWRDRKWTVAGLPSEPGSARAWSINEAQALPHPGKDALCARVLKQIHQKRDDQARRRKGKDARPYVRDSVGSQKRAHQPSRSQPSCRQARVPPSKQRKGARVAATGGAASTSTNRPWELIVSDESDGPVLYGLGGVTVPNPPLGAKVEAKLHQCDDAQPLVGPNFELSGPRNFAGVGGVNGRPDGNWRGQHPTMKRIDASPAELQARMARLLAEGNSSGRQPKRSDTPPRGKAFMPANIDATNDEASGNGRIEEFIFAGRPPEGVDLLDLPNEVTLNFAGHHLTKWESGNTLGDKVLAVHDGWRELTPQKLQSSCMRNGCGDAGGYSGHAGMVNVGRHRRDRAVESAPVRSTSQWRANGTSNKNAARFGAQTEALRPKVAAAMAQLSAELKQHDPITFGDIAGSAPNVPEWLAGSVSDFVVSTHLQSQWCACAALTMSC
jgi:hypothetical protein